MTQSATSIESPIGWLTIITTDNSVLSVSWARQADGEQTPLLAEAVSQLQAYFAGELTAFDLPLKPEGSDFRKRVWQAMDTIPYSQTRTYGWLSQQVRTAPRAIGGACGANPIPIILPCHRVVGANGQLTGYSGGKGVDTKLWLLSHEVRNRRP